MPLQTKDDLTAEIGKGTELSKINGNIFKQLAASHNTIARRTF